MKNKLLYHLDRIELYVAYVLIFVMLVSATAGVIFRYIFNSSLSWTDELGRWGLIWLSMLGASHCARNNNHLKVDVISSVFLKNHPTGLKVLKTFLCLLTVAFCLLFAYHGWVMTSTSADYGNAIQIPLKLIYASFPICFALMAVRCVQYTAGVWLAKETAENSESTLTDKEETKED